MDNLQNNPGSYFEPEQGESKGALVGAIIVILLLVIGGVYVLTADRTETTPTSETDQIVSPVKGEESTSTDLESIEQDLNNIDTNQTDQNIDNAL